MMVALVVSILTIFVVLVQDRRITASVTGCFVGLTGPVSEAVSKSAGFFSRLWTRYIFLVSVSRENTELRNRLAKAEVRMSLLAGLKSENKRLRNLLEMKARMPYKVAAASVVAMDPSPWFHTLVIDKGADDGVKPGAAVIAVAGIVGQVYVVSAHYAKVKTIVDSECFVDSMTGSSGARGIVSGLGPERCRFDYVMRRFDISVGDMVVTSGMDGIYPGGLPVGRVCLVRKPNSGLFQEIEVVPAVDFNSLREVLIVLGDDEHDAGELLEK